jgi:type I restriction enzyme, S subunit
MTDLTQNAPILGSPAFVKESDRFLHNQRLGKITDLDESKIDRHFLYHIFNSQSVREQIKATATGATVKHTAPERIYQVKVELPPLPFQRKIFTILSAYDDRIENNTRRIKILEEMAQIIYREWFVQYRFPGFEKVKMVKSQLGLIPEGWEISQVGNIATVHRGRSYKSSELMDYGGMPFLNLKCIERDGGFRRNGIKRYSGDFKPTQSS